MVSRIVTTAALACVACGANAQQTIYFNNFDTDDGGWSSTGTGGFNGDWEHT